MRARLGSLLTFGLLTAGCVEVTDFDPVGDAASIAFEWTVDGAFPTEESCEALGADYVRVTFVDGQRPVPLGGLLRPCASCPREAPRACLEERPCMRAGEVECYDTDPDRVVREGEWTIRLEAVDSSGSVVQASPDAVYSTASGRIEVAPASFFSGRISARFTVDGADPTFNACEDRGIAAVELAFDAAGGALGEGGVEACTVGGVGVRVQPGASYTVRLRTLGPDGAVLGESPPETFTIEAGQEATLGGDEPIELTTL